MTAPITEAEVAAYQRDGAVCLRGVFKDWVATIAAGIERNMREPGQYASESVRPGEPGSFFDDYCNWERIPEFQHVVRESPAAELAAAAMGSTTAQFFHDHVLVKEPGTQKPTPWHQDIPYYFVDGTQTVSFWIPIDPVEQATLRLIAGSHRWDKWVLPVRWLDEGSFYAEAGDYRPVPDPDREPGQQVLEWPMAPGDVLLFDFRTVHGARGNPAATRRRALSLRWVGDDARFAQRPGRTSPPYPGHGMTPGQRLREDWFPVLWPRQRAPRRKYAKGASCRCYGGCPSGAGPADDHGCGASPSPRACCRFTGLVRPSGGSRGVARSQGSFNSCRRAWSGRRHALRPVIGPGSSRPPSTRCGCCRRLMSSPTSGAAGPMPRTPRRSPRR